MVPVLSSPMTLPLQGVSVPCSLLDNKEEGPGSSNGRETRSWTERQRGRKGKPLFELGYPSALSPAGAPVLVTREFSQQKNISLFAAVISKQSGWLP